MSKTHPWGTPKAGLVCFASYLASLHVHLEMVCISDFLVFSMPKPGDGVYIWGPHDAMKPSMSCHLLRSAFQHWRPCCSNVRCAHVLPNEGPHVVHEVDACVCPSHNGRVLEAHVATHGTTGSSKYGQHVILHCIANSTEESLTGCHDTKRTT